MKNKENRRSALKQQNDMRLETKREEYDGNEND